MSMLATDGSLLGSSDTSCPANQRTQERTYSGKNERTLEVDVDHEGPDGTVVGVLDRDDGRYARHTHCPQGFRRSNHAGHCDVTNTSLLTTLMFMML